MGKYQPLADHLATLKTDTWRPSLKELEAVLGFELPKTARSQPSWWSNEGAEGRPHKKAWLDAGWTVENPDLGSGLVTFRRKPGEAAAPPAIKEAVKAYDSRKRAAKVGKAAIGGGIVAALVGVASGVSAFLLGRRRKT